MSKLEIPVDPGANLSGRLVQMGLSFSGGFFELPAATKDLWVDVYEQRLALSAENDRYAFMFEIDRLTNPYLIPLAGVPAGELQSRVEQVLALIEFLRLRLKIRASGFTPTSRYPRRWVAYFSAIFLDCDHVLVEHTPVSAFSFFSAGYLRRTLKLKDQPDHITASGEPDSCFVYLFAEFALLCLEQGVDADRWRPRLQALIAMQSVYCFRVAPWEPAIGHRRFLKVPPPMPSTFPALTAYMGEVWQIERLYDGKLEPELIAMMNQNSRPLRPVLK